MKKCLLCKDDQLVYYGDERYGEVFCRDCFNKYSCLHCKQMNIILSFDKDNKVIDVEIKKLHGSIVEKNSILSPLFPDGHRFKLYCKECWDSGETDKNVDDDEDLSIEPDEDDYDSYYSDDEEEEDYDSNNYNSYYTGKGKYDLY